MSVKIIEHQQFRWINIDTVNDEAIQYLKKNFNFHHLDLEDIQGESQTPKVDSYKNYLFAVLQFPRRSTQSNKIISAQIDFFIGENFLVTVQHSKSKDIKHFFYRCMKNRTVRREWMNKGSGYLMYNIIESLYRTSQPLLNQTGKELAALEEEIYSEDQDPKIIQKLAIHRRNILSFRRIIDPQRYVVSTLSNIRRPFLTEEIGLYFDNVYDYLSKVWSVLDSYNDTVGGLHITVESLLSQKTNRILNMLTVISVALMPPTLIASAYGMNIDKLPFAHNPTYVWIILLGVLGLNILVALLLRRKKWL